MRIFAASILAALATVSANKDDTYYSNGVTNPNVDLPMYWHEGYNVLEDLSKFDKLYVTYHNCAWETPTGDDEDGGGGDESDTWYLGTVPPARANVAYSLYGVLKGEKDSGCNKKTFINSFHSTQGLESFTNSMAAAGLTNLFELYDGEEDNDDGLDTVTSTCYQDEDQDGNDGDDAVNNGEKYSQSTSYGLGCTVDGEHQFAIHTYNGAYCDANAIAETLDDLEDLNERLELTKCVPIYTDGDSYSADDDEEVTALDILATSRACRIHDGTKSCPDPYNQLKKREKALNKATAAIYGQPFWSAQRVMRSAWAMIGGGIFLTVLAIGLAIRDYMNKTGSMGKQRKKKRSKKRNKGGDDEFDAPVKPSRERSELSQSIESLASQISETLGLTGGSNHSKKSKRSNKSKQSKRSGKSESNRSERSRHSKHSSNSKQAGGVDAPGTIDLSRSEMSDTSNLSLDRFEDVEDHDIDMDTNRNVEGDGNIIPVRDGEESVQESIASKSVQAASDMMNFLKKTAESFMDEHDDESVEMRIPDELPQPRSSRSNRSLPKEAEVNSNWTGNEEAASKKKWRKRRWFRKLIGRK